MPLRINFAFVNFVVFAILFLALNWRINSFVEKKAEDFQNVSISKSGSIIFYNRIPKTGSTTLTNALGHDLSVVNHFHTIHVNLTKNNFAMNLVDQGLLIRNICTWTEVQPAFYHGHVAFLDFNKFGYANPIYINLVREPFDRFLSYYYFLRYGHIFLKPLILKAEDCFVGDNYRVGLKRSRAGNNQTFDQCVQKNGKDCDSKNMWLQIPYDVGNEKALQQAKWNLSNRYLVVGLTERLEDMVALLEHLLPSFFDGAIEHFQSLTESRAHLRYTKKKIAPSNAVAKMIKDSKVYQMERDFYDYAIQEFDNIWKKTRNAEGNFLKKQHHYDKIRP